MKKDDLRTTIGTTLIFVVAIVSYLIIPFLYLYIGVVVISIGLMIGDYFSNDPKKGMAIYVLKFTTLIPVINLLPLLIIPIFSVVNLFFKNKIK